MVFPRCRLDVSCDHSQVAHLLEDDDRATRIDFVSAVESLLDNITSGQPGFGKVVEVRDELLAGYFGRLGKASLGSDPYMGDNAALTS